MTESHKFSPEVDEWLTKNTTPFDPRFPNQNQTRHCYMSFLDFQRCIRKHGEDYGPCDYYRKAHVRLCPSAWVDRWNDQIEAGTFPGDLDPPKQQA